MASAVGANLFTFNYSHKVTGILMLTLCLSVNAWKMEAMVLVDGDNTNAEGLDDAEDFEDYDEYCDYDDDDSLVDGLCFALRDNDPSVTTVDALHVGRNRLNDLFDELPHSTFVTTLKVCATRFQDGPFEAIQALLTYTETSRQLRDIQLFTRDGYEASFTPPYRNPDCDEIGSRIIHAILANPQIEAFSHYCNLPPHLLAHLLKETLSLKHLTIYTDSFHYATSHPIVASALAENRSLVSLRLDAQSNAEIAPTLLQHLQFHPTLRQLKLHLCLDEASIALSEAIASLLRSTSLLQQLEHFFYRFDATHFDTVFTALKRPNSQRSLTKLSLGYCNFDAQATAELIDFVQNVANADSNVLRELCLTGLSDDTFAGSSVGKVAAEMLVDSSLEILRIERYAHIEIVDFFEDLESVTSRVRLSDLQLDRLSSTEFAAMVRYLRASANLQHISVDDVAEDVQFSSQLLTALRSNGTLRQFTVRDDDFWTQVGAHHIRAGCQRNRCLPELLGTPSRTSDSSARKDWTLIPTLCVCAQQAPSTAIQNMLIGLLAFGDYM
jgi:hypothetical protein